MKCSNKYTISRSIPLRIHNSFKRYSVNIPKKLFIGRFDFCRILEYHQKVKKVRTFSAPSTFSTSSTIFNDYKSLLIFSTSEFLGTAPTCLSATEPPLK